MELLFLLQKMYRNTLQHFRLCTLDNLQSWDKKYCLFILMLPLLQLPNTLMHAFTDLNYAYM